MDLRRIAGKILQFPENPSSLHDVYEQNQDLDRPTTDLEEFRKSKETKDRVLMRIKPDQYILMPWTEFKRSWDQYETKPHESEESKDAQYKSVCRKVVEEIKNKATELGLYNMSGGYTHDFKDSDDGVAVLDRTMIFNRLKSRGLYVVFNVDQIEYTPRAGNIKSYHPELMKVL